MAAVISGGAPVLRTVGLTRHFAVGGRLHRRRLHAVEEVDLEIGAGEIVALVGESGSGKSTVIRLLANLDTPTSGHIYFNDRELSGAKGRSLTREYRQNVAMIFQNPFGSLNPAYPISHGISRTIALHKPSLSGREVRRECIRALEDVGLTPGTEFIDRHPYELSGGQRQRVGFAQALSFRPRVILADEPVSMLDASMRVELLNLMGELRRREGIAFLYVTHDLASASYISDRILVMYAGRIVESGPTPTVIDHPVHPYTQLLLSSVPVPDAAADLDEDIDLGEPPHVVDPGPGCLFRWRCPLASDVCAEITPRLRDFGESQAAACHNAVRREPQKSSGPRSGPHDTRMTA